MASAEGQPAEAVIHHLLTIHRHLRQYSKRVSAELGISGRQLSVLRHLRPGPLSVGQISGLLYVSDSTASELLAGLEERGLLVRSRSSEDNRVALAVLTSAGHDLVARAPLGGISLLRQRLRSQPVEQAIALAGALECLARLMEIDQLEHRQTSTP